MRILYRTVALALSAAALAAQGRTWIVDAAGGGQFTDLPAAEVAAAHGDLLEVRPGLYSPFQTSKGIAVLGQGSVRLRGNAPFLGGLVEVRSLPAGRTFSMRNVAVEYLPPAHGILLDGNQGRVHLHELRVGPQPNSFTQGLGAALRVTNCLAVTVHGCSLVGNSAIWSSDARIAVAASQVHGVSAIQGLGPPIAPAGNGLIATRSSVHFARSNVRGGNGLTNFFLQTQPPREAIVANDAALLVTGDATDSVQAGVHSTSPPLAAIVANGGTLHRDPLVTIAGSQGGPPIVGNTAVVVRRIVSLIADGGVLGGPVTGEIVSPAGDPLALLLSLPIDPVDTGLGTVWFDPLLAITLVHGAQQNASEHFPFAFVFPNLAPLRGIPIVLQAASFDVASARLELSNPAVLVLDR
jgi:hypothetical protein